MSGIIWQWVIEVYYAKKWRELKYRAIARARFTVKSRLGGGRVRKAVEMKLVVITRWKRKKEREEEEGRRKKEEEEGRRKRWEEENIYTGILSE